jgi:hypothetical protein
VAKIDVRHERPVIADAAVTRELAGWCWSLATLEEQAQFSTRLRSITACGDGSAWERYATRSSPPAVTDRS